MYWKVSGGTAFVRQQGFAFTLWKTGVHSADDGSIRRLKSRVLEGSLRCIAA